MPGPFFVYPVLSPVKDADMEQSETIRRVRRVTFVGMVLNSLLALAKGAGGLVFKSHALVADAIHSFSDLVTDFAVIFGVRYWSAPPDEEHPYGTVAGAQPAYTEDETDTVSRGLIELQDGDRLDFLCDFYSYDGEYQDSYFLGEPVIVSGDLSVSDTLLGGTGRVLYRFTDIYQQHYWTEVLPED